MSTKTSSDVEGRTGPLKVALASFIGTTVEYWRNAANNPAKA